MLKPQDVLVLLKLVALGPEKWSYAELAVQLGMSPSQLHAAIKRVLSAHLAVRRDDLIVPNLRNLEEFLIHGLKYVFVPERGEMTRGIPTGYAAPPLNAFFSSNSEPPPVWPDPQGSVRGFSFAPLYPLAPVAAQADPLLYQLLVLIDGIRGGRARERALAIDELKKRLANYE